MNKLEKAMEEALEKCDEPAGDLARELKGLLEIWSPRSADEYSRFGMVIRKFIEELK